MLSNGMTLDTKEGNQRRQDRVELVVTKEGAFPFILPGQYLAKGLRGAKQAATGSLGSLQVTASTRVGRKE